MTLSDLLKTDVDDVFLDVDDFAEVILRYVGGERSRAVEITAVVTWYNTNAEHDSGRNNRRRGELLLNDASTITVKDAFMIEGNRVEVEAVDPIQDGAQTVYVMQHIPESKGAVPVRRGEV